MQSESILQSGGWRSRFTSETTHRFALAAIVTVSSILCAKGFSSAAAVAAFVAVCVCFVVEASRSQIAQADKAIACGMLVWFVVTPIASFFLRLPEQRSLLTFDRLAFATLAAAVLIRAIRFAKQSYEGVRVIRFELFWAFLAVVALISVILKSRNIGFAARTAVDSLVLPLIAFYLARRYVNVESYRRGLLLSCIGLALFLCVTGSYELATGVNLFQYAGSELIRAGELRVNGPFSTDSSFAIIAVLLFLFLRAAPRALRIRFDSGGSLIYAAALAAALVTSFLPLYRGVTIGLLVSWSLYELVSRGLLFSKRGKAVTARVLLFVAGVILLIAVPVGLLALAGRGSAALRLADPENLFSRAASWQAALKMLSDNPVFGVGFWNFSDVFEADYSSEWLLVEEVFDTRIATGAHSNAFWIASELGLVGFVPYGVAMILLLLMGYRAAKRAETDEHRSVAACFLALVFGYSIPGLVLTSGAYSDLNLVFFFLVGLLSRRL